MSPLRVVLVDDHEVVLQGLATILGRFLGRVRVVGQALDADTAQKLAATLNPGIVLCDIRLKGTSGLDLCRKLVERDPAAKVVLLSAYDDEQYLFQAMRVGAKGYLLKQITGEDLVRHLERVAEGETTRAWPGGRSRRPRGCTAGSSGRARASGSLSGRARCSRGPWRRRPTGPPPAGPPPGEQHSRGTSGRPTPRRGPMTRHARHRPPP